MAVQFNHTLVNVADKRRAAQHFVDVMGLGRPRTYEPFLVVELDNDASIGFFEVERVTPQHYAYLVSEGEFDEIVERLDARDIPWWADHSLTRLHAWNTDDGGRGLYWRDLDGHLLELMTRPYTLGDLV